LGLQDKTIESACSQLPIAAVLIGLKLPANCSRNWIQITHDFDDR
jgi:hypothetical protein